MDMNAFNEKLDAFTKLLPSVCVRETSADPERWTPENPLWGHCAVVTTAAFDRFGGTMLRASLENYPKWAVMRSHYWNRFPNGAQRDFTVPQFDGDPPLGMEPIERTRAYVLSHPATLERYKLFAWRLAKIENVGNALFDGDDINSALYRTCYMAAAVSPCQKMRFGAVLMHQGTPVAIACNGTIEPLKHLCEPTCIRLGIQSRTESMIGACGHAEEFAMASGMEKGIKLFWTPSPCSVKSSSLCCQSR